MAVKKIKLNSSVFAASALVLDSGMPPDYHGYPMFGNLLDMPYVSDVTIVASRQVGKSIFVVTKSILSSLPFNHKYTYIAPTEKQAKDFSRLKLGITLEKSKFIRKLLMHRNSPLLPPGEPAPLNSIVNDVYMKKFANSSFIKIGYASDAEGVDRIRGGTTDELTVDEAQSTDLDALMPVLRPMLRAAKYPIINAYGTPLNENDSLIMRFNESTQHTGVLKCSACNRWTTLDTLRVIGRNGLVCPRCGAPLHIQELRFVPMNPSSKHFGVHINRLMLRETTASSIKWQQLLNDIEDPNVTEDGIIREVLGRPSGTASRMVDKDDIRRAAILDPIYVNKSFAEIISLAQKTRAQLRKPPYRFVYAIDWGGGAMSISGGGLESDSRTAEVLMGMHVDRGYVAFDLLYHKLYPLAHPKHALIDIKKNIATLPPESVIACDALGGTFAISELRDYIAEQLRRGHKFFPVQLGNVSETKVYKELEDRLVISKTVAMVKFFTALLHNRIFLQNDGATIDFLAKQFLAEVEIEKHDGGRLWRKESGKNDDVLLAFVFGFVLSSFFYEPSLL